MFFRFLATRSLPACDRTPLELQGNARSLRPRLNLNVSELRSCSFLHGYPRERGRGYRVQRDFYCLFRESEATRGNKEDWRFFFSESDQTLFYSTRKGSEKHVAFREMSGPFITAA